MPRWIHRVASAAALLALGACATVTEITASPEGAEISLFNQVLGTTPLRAEIQDRFGWFSTYEFTARKPGYKPRTLVFREEKLGDDARVVPPRLHFELEPDPDAPR